MTEAKAIAIMNKTEIAPASTPASTPVSTPGPEVNKYSPRDVLETLKLLSKGDLTGEQMDVYEENAGRLRAYAAVLKSRALTEPEQEVVNEIGRRLDAEAKSIATEDVGYAQDQQRELSDLAVARQIVEREIASAEAAATAADFEMSRAAVLAQQAETEAIHFAGRNQEELSEQED